jgi:hypothetical protein
MYHPLSPDTLPHPLPTGEDFAGITILEFVKPPPPKPGHPHRSERSGAHRYLVRYTCCGYERVITRRSIRARLQAQEEGQEVACSVCTRRAKQSYGKKTVNAAPFITRHGSDPPNYIGHWPVVVFSLDEKHRKQQPKGDY